MKELSQHLIDLKPSGIRRFFDIVADNPEAISLGVGEPDFNTPWEMTEEGIRALKAGRTFYTANAGLLELREEIASYLNELIGITYDPETEVMVTVGGSEGIDLACRALINPGDEVILPEPAFVSYRPCVVMAGGSVKTIQLEEAAEFKLTPEQLEEAITDKTKAVILSYPNNPTGAIMTRADLEKLIPVIKKHDLYVITDEIYAELVYGEKHVSIASLAGMRERTIVINGFSKSFAMTGWRLGFMAAPAHLMEEMLKLHQYALMCAPTISQYAALAGLKGDREFIGRMRESYEQRRNYLLHELKRIGLATYPARGAFYLFPNIQQYEMTSEEFALKLLDEEELAVVPGDAFGACGEGFIRISYAYSLDQLKEAVERLEKFLKNLS